MVIGTDEFGLLFLLWNDSIPSNAERKGIFGIGMNYVFLLMSFTSNVIFINLVVMTYSTDDESYEEVEYLRTVPPPQTMNNEVKDIVSQSPHHNEIQWLMTKKPSPNESHELAIKIECELESAKKREESKVSHLDEAPNTRNTCKEDEEVFGPYSKETCLFIVASYVEMLHLLNKAKKIKKRDWCTKDNKWFLINSSNLKKAKKDLETSYKSGEKVSTIL